MEPGRRPRGARGAAAPAGADAMAFTHVVVLKLQEGTAAEKKDAIVAGLRALPKQIPEIRTYRAGVDLGLDPSGCHIGIVGEFDSAEAYNTYAKHPAHTSLIAEQIKPVLAKRAAVQFTPDAAAKLPAHTAPALTHCVLLKLKADATAEQRQAIIDGLSALPKEISQIRAYRVGPDAGNDPSKFNIAIVGDFDSESDYQAYAKHDKHTGVIKTLIKPILAERVAVQFSGRVEPHAVVKAARFLGSAAMLLVQLGALAAICYAAVDIRLHAVKNYGRVIHEFDPWFNYRATEYLSEHGWSKFSTWYDYMSWYPIGRPVGATIYPGMQVTAVAIHETMKALDGPVMASLTNAVGIPNGFDGVLLNDVCVLLPAAFGAVASVLTAALATEATNSRNAGVASAAVMAIMPAHLMRSVAGGYDNESIAVSAIVLTFWLWCRSLRHDGSWKVFGPLTGLAYFYMVATWGGYIFVLNVIAAHAALLVLLGRYDTNLHRSYSLFFIIGTYGAVQIPIVGWQPFQSLEQVAALLVFVGLQLCEMLAIGRKAFALRGFKLFQYYVFVLTVAVALFAVGIKNIPDGYIGPLSARIRGLFVAHTQTGNPLVDSVAEHQATPPSVFQQYFPVVHQYAMFGIIPLMLSSRTNAKIFVLLQSAVAMYFTRKMIRLVLVLSLGASICMGALIGMTVDWAIAQWVPDIFLADSDAKGAPSAEKEDGLWSKAKTAVAFVPLKLYGLLKSIYNFKIVRLVRMLVAVVLVGGMVLSCLDEASQKQGMKSVRKVVKNINLAINSTGYGKPFKKAWFPDKLEGGLEYWDTCQMMAPQMSEPQIMMRGRNRDGSEMMIDDFREAYWWLRDNTPEDARVMAWWDYGYQITGVGNRTTIADGNTWNHEHIALLGKCLTSTQSESHKIVRHMADYVLAWSTSHAGMMGDDIAKSPHMARIGGSVYKDINPDEWGQDHYGRPSKKMRESLLYTIINHRLDVEMGKADGDPVKLDIDKKSKKPCV
eukprot:COSAG02_NODE_1529_length_12087_cov_326.174258_4_plen_997_part_00